MKNLSIVLLIMVATSLQADYIKDGQALFEKYKCNMCHKLKDEPLSVAPSLALIRKHYLGNERGLSSFLKGEAKPIVDPKKFAMMKQQLYKTDSLSDKELRALSVYITYEHK